MKVQQQGRAALSLRVSGITWLTDRIKAFELIPTEGVLPPFDAGAHVDVVTGNGAVRSYSLLNDPAERHRYIIAVLREPYGQGSGWMHDSVVPGDVLEVLEPRNAFGLSEDASEHILIAGGIGITPILSMAHHLKATGGRFRLIYCTRSAEETAFRDEVVERFGPSATLHHDGGDPTCVFDLAGLLRERLEGAHVYVCGPRGMIRAVRDAAAHWPANAVHFEIFASPAQQPVAAADTATGQPLQAAAAMNVNEPFEVELASTGQVFKIPADRSILDVLLESGLKLPYVCKEGWCGNCELGLCSGCADHRDEVLSDEEKTSNTKIQICVSRAARGERLVLDR